MCAENKASEDLEKRELYAVLPDEEAAQGGYLHAIDESGEDYLYPASYLILLDVPAAAQKALGRHGDLPLQISRISARQICVNRRDPSAALGTASVDSRGGSVDA